MNTITKSPRRGSRAYKLGEPAFYVVNRQTNIGSEPYATREEAEREAVSRNAIPPATPGLLVVVEIPDEPT